MWCKSYWRCSTPQVKHLHASISININVIRYFDTYVKISVSIFPFHRKVFTSLLDNTNLFLYLLRHISFGQTLSMKIYLVVLTYVFWIHVCTTEVGKQEFYRSDDARYLHFRSSLATLTPNTEYQLPLWNIWKILFISMLLSNFLIGHVMFSI